VLCTRRDALPAPSPSRLRARACVCRDGWCECHCGYVGSSCSIALDITPVDGLSGEVAGSNVGAKSYFGQASGEMFFRVPIPAGETRLRVSTCTTRSSFATALWVLEPCVTMQIADADVLAAKASTGCNTSASVVDAPMIELTSLSTDAVVVMVEGVGDATGTFVLTWIVGDATEVNVTTRVDTVGGTSTSKRLQSWTVGVIVVGVVVAVAVALGAAVYVRRHGIVDGGGGGGAKAAKAITSRRGRLVHSSGVPVTPPCLTGRSACNRSLVTPMTSWTATTASGRGRVGRAVTGAEAVDPVTAAAGAEVEAVARAARSAIARGPHPLAPGLDLDPEPQRQLVLDLRRTALW
jgi:hypothetical protein